MEVLLLRRALGKRMLVMKATLSDGDLLGLARHDPAALEALYRRHVGSLMAHAARRCRRPEDVADVVATTFVVVLESAEGYDASRGGVLPWMIGIARHLASDSARSARRERDILARLAGLRSLEDDEIVGRRPTPNPLCDSLREKRHAQGRQHFGGGPMEAGDAPIPTQVCRRNILFRAV